jgi:citrate synthase
MMKGEDNYTKLDADILDLCLVLHAEHGGGNNSSFTARVTSSTGTDTYSSIASAIASLKGPFHGGANLRVLDMMENIKENVKDWSNEKEVLSYLIKILKKEAHNRTGKIYGIGHAVYTKSDPRTIILKQKARELAIEKGKLEEFELYSLVEKLAPLAFQEFKSESSKVLCANVDFYSGFVYACIGIPKEVFTPLFAIARVAGWSAHRLEEINFAAKRVIRPSYKFVAPYSSYIPVDQR